MTMDDKEAIYDKQIAPLMTQLLEVCQREGIPFFASFQVSGGGFCTSVQSTGHCVFDHYRALTPDETPNALRLNAKLGGSLRQRFAANAEQFDTLMVEMLAENDRLHTGLHCTKRWCQTPP